MPAFSPMEHAEFKTAGQVAQMLRVSVSTLKRWLEETPELVIFRANAAGWRLFSPSEIETLRAYARARKKLGRRFKPSTLRPVNE